MKKILLIPTIIFPYIMVLTIALYFIIGNMSDAFLAFFSNNVKYIGTGLLSVLLLAIVANIFFITSNKSADTSQILNAALIVKCLHIPTYILIFGFGILLIPMFFMTTPLIMFLVFLDIITLCLSDMISVYAIVKKLKENSAKKNVQLVITLICQFVFCADVISLIVINRKLRKQRY